MGGGGGVGSNCIIFVPLWTIYVEDSDSDFH